MQDRDKLAEGVQDLPEQVGDLVLLNVTLQVKDVAVAVRGVTVAEGARLLDGVLLHDEDIDLERVCVTETE